MYVYSDKKRFPDKISLMSSRRFIRRVKLAKSKHREHWKTRTNLRPSRLSLCKGVLPLWRFSSHEEQVIASVQKCRDPDWAVEASKSADGKMTKRKCFVVSTLMTGLRDLYFCRTRVRVTGSRGDGGGRIVRERGQGETGACVSHPHDNPCGGQICDGQYNAVFVLKPPASSAANNNRSKNHCTVWILLPVYVRPARRK